MLFKAGHSQKNRVFEIKWTLIKGRVAANFRVTIYRFFHVNKYCFCFGY